ncbi:MAG: hypothetical protein R3279_05865 [Putridiphycobacter sp.]|nr:hypothetical protein [Putridiphycobacter sp.]
MNDKKAYLKFLKVFDQLAEKVLNENEPKKAVGLIENNFKELDNSFKAAIPFLESTNDIEDDAELTKTQDHIRNEIEDIYAKVKHEPEKIRVDFRLKESIAEIYRSLYIYVEEAGSILRGIKPFYPTNPDYILITDEYMLKKNSLNGNLEGNDLYKGIVFSNSAFRQEFYELLANRVAVENRYVLEQLLLGRKIQGKLLFSGSVELFAMYFSLPFHYGLISSTREVLLNWMIDNFQTYSNRGPFDVKYDTIKKKFPSNTYKNEEPESSDQHVNEIIHLVTKYK